MKKNRIIALLIVFVMTLSPIAIDAASMVSIDSTDAEEGIVKISCTGIDKKTKVMVEKGSIKYYYDLKNAESFFPLQLGDGNYTVAVLENTTGIKYKVLTKKNFNAEISEENSVYLSSSQPVLWNDDMEAIKFAALITEGMEDDKAIVQKLYDYMINNIDYDYKKVDKLSSDYIPDIDTVLEAGKGICYDYSVLFGAMLRSRGIPSKLVMGYRDDISSYHSWNEVYIDGSWEIIDTTYDAKVLSDGTSFKMFQDTNKYKKQKEY